MRKKVIILVLLIISFVLGLTTMFFFTNMKEKDSPKTTIYNQYTIIPVL